ncbi:DUF1659 domain-containing protein [Clostridium butyricum]|uniref:DUF1659 domain-containing protein n=1 Tax=Clostridium butyricum TaxID=1492 RepID=UPI001CA7D268|nr:DUF1659 domain-containing protein [Clostridium butyricum]MBZ0312433.1 DUF1659 domain-containing protein [Clostridium butyricum]
MAVNKIPESASFSIEVRKGTDALGNPTYSKKSFSNVREDADAEKVLAVAVAIKKVLSGETRNCYLTAVDQLMQA